MNAVAIDSQLLLSPCSGNKLSREQTLKSYSSLVRLVARRMVNRFPSSLDIDDLISDGYMGLMDAMEKFDSNRDLSFGTYAEFRIRGAMLDGIRRQDWIPRSVRNKAKAYSRVYQELEKSLGRTASSEEIRTALGLDLDAFHEFRSKFLGTTLLSIIDLEAGGRSMESCMLDADPTEVTPYSELEVQSLRSFLEKEIERLPDVHQQILTAYYFEDMPLKEVAQTMAFTESRASQIHRDALARLRGHLDRRLKRREKKARTTLA